MSTLDFSSMFEAGESEKVGFVTERDPLLPFVRMNSNSNDGMAFTEDLDSYLTDLPSPSKEQAALLWDELVGNSAELDELQKPKTRSSSQKPQTRKMRLSANQSKDLIQYLARSERVVDEDEEYVQVASPPPRRQSKRQAPPPSPSPSVVSNKSWGSCLSRQAVYAREYRQKNKTLVTELQERIGDLETDNSSLQSESSNLKETVADLREEVSYLRSVLANESQLAPLLQGLKNTPGVKLRFPTETQKRPAVGPKKKKVRVCESTMGRRPGVCLHVQDDGVSVEFCAQCNRQSRLTSAIRVPARVSQAVARLVLDIEP